MLQELPAVLAAIVAAAVCALTLPIAVGPSLDLSAFFSNSNVPVTFRPDLMALGQAAGVITVLAGVALIGGTSRLRHRDVTGTLPCAPASCAGVYPMMMASESGDGSAASPITPARRPG